MIRVCPLSALPTGEALCVDAEPPIAVFHAEDGEVSAVDDTCTHQDASLADGWVEGCEVDRPAVAVAALLRGSAASEVHADDSQVRIPYFWSDQYDVRIQFAGHAAEADSVTIEEGTVEGNNLLAVYRRGHIPVGVLGMNQARLFGRWRRQLNAAVSV